jgi:hypothetical protein
MHAERRYAIKYTIYKEKIAGRERLPSTAVAKRILFIRKNEGAG